jgi:predicted ATPase/class 3 adenylate cyclase
MIMLPSGTVTFLFTDIEGSTRLWQEHPEAMSLAHARHDEILRQAIESNNGYIFQIVGDSFSAAFHNAMDGLHAVLSAQRGLQVEPWGETATINVRMGLHTGSAEILPDGKYEGYATIASTQRVMSAAHGGQTLLTQTTHDLLQNELPDGVSLRDMSEHHLKGLRAPLRLYQLVAPDLQQQFPPIKSLDALTNNLPAQLTSFIGREKEISEIKEALSSPLPAGEGPGMRQTRLLSLTGSGGTGKTRLSIEVGTQLLTNFPNGVWLIELAPLMDESQIIPVIAQAFGLQELPFRPLQAQVLDFLRDKKTLLILDNCEHLIAACAHLTDDLLHQCAGLKILASSREALGISGELVYHTPSLADSESTRLFVERARAVNPKFFLTDSNAPFIAQICHRLDGIPLAIELAAARVKLLSVEQIATRLDDMFRLLVGGSRTALPRQQTLRALIDWSYDLLSEEEKRLLQITSVFVGGWTLDALEAVSEDPNTLEYLEGLVNKSLVFTEEREGEMRYFLLETIRQYAREKLFEAKQASAARDRHFIYYVDLSEKMWDMFRSPNAMPMIDKVDAEVENFRAALEWGLENHIEDNLRLAANFCATSTTLSIPAEGVRIVTAAMERVKSLPPAQGEAGIRRQKLIAKSLFVQSMVGLGVGNLPLIVRALKEAIAISRATGDKQMLGYSLGMYYTASTFINAPDGEEAAREAFQIFSHEVNDSFGLGNAYMNMARLSGNKGNESERERYMGKLREMADEMPRSFQISMFILGMGMDERLRGNYDAARKIFEEGLELFERLHSRNFVLVMRSELGHVERQTGNLTQAKSIYGETIRGWQDLGNRSAVAHELECFGFLAIHDEEPERAVKLFSAAEALRERIQAPMTDYERVEYDQMFAQVRAILKDAEFSALWAEGRSMTMEQAIEFALSI